ARSIWLTACRNSSVAVCRLPSLTAAWYLRMAVFIRDRIIRLRRVRLAVTRTRFSAERVLGTSRPPFCREVNANIVPHIFAGGYRDLPPEADCDGRRWGLWNWAPSTPSGPAATGPAPTSPWKPGRW